MKNWRQCVKLTHVSSSFEKRCEVFKEKRSSLIPCCTFCCVSLLQGDCISPYAHHSRQPGNLCNIYWIIITTSYKICKQFVLNFVDSIDVVFFFVAQKYCQYNISSHLLNLSLVIYLAELVIYYVLFRGCDFISILLLLRRTARKIAQALFVLLTLKFIT